MQVGIERDIVTHPILWLVIFPLPKSPQKRSLDEWIMCFLCKSLVSMTGSPAHVGAASECIHALELEHRVFGAQRALERERDGGTSGGGGGILECPVLRNANDDQQLHAALHCLALHC